MKRLSVAIILAFLWTCTAPSLKVSAQGTCDPENECCIIECNTVYDIPESAECISDPCLCAQKIDCILRAQRDSWNTYPLNGALHLNTAVTHGRYVETRVNPTAEASINNFLHPAPGPVEIAYGSIIAKDNYRPDPKMPGVPLRDETSPFPTLMIKIKGYCLEDPILGRDCRGVNGFGQNVLRISSLALVSPAPASVVTQL